MKKIISLIIALIMAATLVVTFAACNPPGYNAELAAIIRDAEGMTLEELEAKAKEEIGENSLTVMGNSSGIVRAATAFTEKYGIAVEANGSLKDAEMYTSIGTALPVDEFYADVVLAQDGYSLLDQINQANFYNYVPNGYTTIANDDKDPLTGILINKLFIYKATDKANPDLKNVWQLAGKASDAGHISNLSFQSPDREKVNMNFLVMLTSPQSCASLEAAYKSYYKTNSVDLKSPDGGNYKNIGYKFIAEFIANVSSWHTSDTSAVKNLSLPADNSDHIPAGTIVYAPLNKFKDAGVEYSLANLTASGFNTTVEGFDGFMYKMYLQVLKTAKYPYAACLFINYLTTSDAFVKGWRGDMGYYSANTEAKIAQFDKTLEHWRSRLIIEDSEFIYRVYSDVSKFIKAELNKIG